MDALISEELIICVQRVWKFPLFVMHQKHTTSDLSHRETLKNQLMYGSTIEIFFVGPGAK